MGNISNIWYSKNYGGSWADTKCELDSCYSIPYDEASDHELYLQAELPLDVNVYEIWLADLNGNRIENIINSTDWKIVKGDTAHRIFFRVPQGKVCRGRLTCFRFEIPLMSNFSPPVEVDTLISEPFYCPTCEPTVKISSDYCFNMTDIFGEYIFDAGLLPGTHYGGLNKMVNDFRIQAVMKQLPSQVKANRNLRCHNYSSSLQQRYKLQGAGTDFPDYMVNIIESIFSGKKIYIDGEEYVLGGEELFTERKVEGRSMMQLNVELVKCPLEVVHKCDCTPDAVVSN